MYFQINQILFLAQQMNGTLVSLEDSDVLSLPPLDDLDMLSGSSQMSEVEQVKAKYSGVMSSCVEKLKHMEQRSMPSFLERVNEMVRKAWTVPSHGHILGNSLCNVLRNNGGLDILMDNCVSGDEALQLSSARLLEQCLTHENRGYVVERGLEKVLELLSFTFCYFRFSFHVFVLIRLSPWLAAARNKTPVWTSHVWARAFWNIFSSTTKERAAMW